MTSPLRIALLFCLISLLTGAASAQDSLVVGANVNMVSGDSFPNGDPFQRQQNEPSMAFSSRNNLHLLAGANDYRAVDVPGLPGGRETGDSWLSYFWSTNGGGTWKSTLIPGYPQDPDCDGSASEPTLCGYAAGADPVVRAGVNGMFYYSGIVFERSDPSRSAIFVSRFIDLNNDEGGDPIRYIDTVLLDTNDDGLVFLDKSWIGVDIPRGSNTKMFDVIQRDNSTVSQTVSCGNLYVGYAAIGGEGKHMRSEIRLATSTDCGDAWVTQPISQPDSLNQGANIAIDPLTGDVHVGWRRFDTVESFLGIPAAGCPAGPSSWEVNDVWPVSTITMGGITYTMEQAQAILVTKHRGDETIKVAYEVIAAKLNLLTGSGDFVPEFNPRQWAQDISGFIADADAWLFENPLGSDPKMDVKQAGMNIKKDIQAILLGSGTCSGEVNGTPGGTTGETNAILVASSDDAGLSFSAPDVIHESSTFDQGSTTYSFRTTAYPTVTVDASGEPLGLAGRIYVAWAARGFATIRNELSDGDARIVVSTSTNGTSWSIPYAIDEPNRKGHQIKPSMLFAGGKLTLVYYDFRQDVSGIFEGFVVDLPQPDRLRHTVDVRVATALPAEAPEFTDYSVIMDTDEPVKPSDSASRYIFFTTDFDDIGGSGNVTLQAEYMVPGFPMFGDGTTPFIGDYVDIAAPNLINDGSSWRFATKLGDVQVWQAVWSDNRDVIPPPDGDWSKYVAPIPLAQPSLFDPTVTIPSCEDVSFAGSDFPSGSLYTGTRNQNIYTASFSNGLVVAAPGNNRPLAFDLVRGFVVFVQNATAETRTFQLTLPSILPTGVEASFAQNQAVTTQVVVIPPFSGAAATVFAALTGTGTPLSETIRVSVVEIGGTLVGSVLLNSDPAAPDSLDTSLLDAEVHNPAILNPAILNPAIFNASVDPSICATDPSTDPSICVLTPAILNPAILNPAILNPAILNLAIFNPTVYTPAILNPAILNPAILNPAILNPAILNPAILNPAILNPAILNPAILNPAVLNPAILNPAILNPAILNPAILNPAILNTAIGADSQQVDVTFSVKNDGNATTAYNLNLTAPQLPGLDYELMVYRLNETPFAQGCVLTTEAQQQLIFNQADPLNNDIDGTFYLEPGQEVLVTFRVLPDTTAFPPGDPATFDVNDIGGQVISQAANTGTVSDPPPSDDFGVPPVPSPLITAATPDPMAPGSGQLVTFTVVNGPAPAFGTGDIVFARNDVTGVTRSTSNFLFPCCPAASTADVRLDGALRPASGVEAGTVWVEYGSGARSNDFMMTFSEIPAAPIINRVSTAPLATPPTMADPSACADFSGTEIGPTDTVLGGDWVRIDAQGLDTSSGRIDVLTTQVALSSTAGLCTSTARTPAFGSSYWVQIPAGVTSDPFTLQIRANQTNEGGGAGDYATINLNGSTTAITGVVLSTSTLTINGASVDYTASMVNNSGGPLSTVVLQAVIEQPGVIKAASGWSVDCGAGVGVLPPGNCDSTQTFHAQNSIGTGTLVGGPATASFILRVNGTDVSTVTVPITLEPEP